MSDAAKKIRTEETLPLEKLDAWMKQHIAGLSGLPEITQYTGGASNWTYRLKYSSHDLVLRRPPAGTKASSAHDMKREFFIQKALMTFYPVPEMLTFCNDQSVVGCDFYIMQRIDGIILRSNLPQGVTLNADDARKLCINAIDYLIKLHRIDVSSANPELAAFSKGAGYTQRQVNGWCDRFVKAKTWNVPSCNYVMQWLKENIPQKEKLCMIHNDYRLDNLILERGNLSNIIGVLDWEMATIGDPLMDLGNSLAYWVQRDDDFVMRMFRRQPTHLPGMMKRSEVINYYCEKTGNRADDFRFYEVFGLFRLAVIVQQIYYRYHHGQSRNKAFKNFWLMVHYLNWRCKKIIKAK
ncbi:MAG: phosphotransferase family protein [Chitinophagales bacterium]|nr:phosphotransferase family protein [Chitinophagales bacterium]